MISYNKDELVGDKTMRKDRVFKSGSSPRDIQNRIRQRSQSPDPSSDIVSSLTKHIERLEAALNERQPVVVEKEVVVGYTDEEFDAELVKALEVEMSKFNERLETESALLGARDAQVIEQEDVIKDLNNKLTSLRSEVGMLQVKLESAESRINDKDSVIEDLRSRPVQVVSGGAVSDEVVVDPERPTMDTVVIDPNESDALGKLEDNITVDDVSITEKEAITDKVDKLKALLGGLRV